MNHKYKLFFRLGIGIGMILASYLIAREFGVFEFLAIEIYVPIVPFFTSLLVFALLAAGFAFAASSVNSLLFGTMREPNYVYDEKNRRIFVRYTSSEIEMCRGETTLRLDMFRQLNFFSRQLHVYETYGLSVTPFGEIISGRSGSDKFVTSDNQVLHFKRHLTGIMITWDEADNPWKVVN